MQRERKSDPKEHESVKEKLRGRDESQARAKWSEDEKMRETLTKYGSTS